MEPTSTPYMPSNPAKNFLLLIAGSFIFFLLLVLVEPVAYFSHYRSSHQDSPPENNSSGANTVAASLLPVASIKNEKKKVDSVALTSPVRIAAPTLKEIEKTVNGQLASAIAAATKADQAFLKINDCKNDAILKELPQVTNMHEFHFKEAAAAIQQNDLLEQMDSSISKCVDLPASFNKIIILGFTDARGSKLVNVKLGLKRANVLRDLLVKKGIPASKISVASFGEELPIASNNTEEGRARNRRVEINILGATGS